MHRLLVALLVVVVSVAPLSRPVSAAGWTPDKCDIDVKYWCYAVFYYTYSGGVEVWDRYYWGSLGNGGAQWWKRHITQDWRNNSGSWTFLQGWAPGSEHYSTGTETVYYQRSIANEGVVRMQNQFKAAGTNNIFCDGYVDWHLSDTGYYWSMSSSPTCLAPAY